MFLGGNAVGDVDNGQGHVSNAIRGLKASDEGFATVHLSLSMLACFAPLLQCDQQPQHDNQRKGSFELRQNGIPSLEIARRLSGSKSAAFGWLASHGTNCCVCDRRRQALTI